MAKILEERIVIRVSKLVKESVADHSLVDGEVLSSIEAVAAELLGDQVVVEATVE